MELLQVMMILAALGGVYTVIFGGLRRRPGRPGAAPFAGYRAVGSDRLGAVVLAVLAVVSLIGASGVDDGIITGLLLGTLFSIGLRFAEWLVRPLMDILGLVAASSTAVRFATSSSLDGTMQPGSRSGVILVVVGVFVVTATVFGRKSLLTGYRGLALFGLVEVAVFVANPEVIYVLESDRQHGATVLLLIIALAAILGFAASEFLLTATALLAMSASAILSVLKLSNDNSGFAAVGAALMAGLLASMLAKR